MYWQFEPDLEFNKLAAPESYTDGSDVDQEPFSNNMNEFHFELFEQPKDEYPGEDNPEFKPKPSIFQELDTKVDQAYDGVQASKLSWQVQQTQEDTELLDRVNSSLGREYKAVYLYNPPPPVQERINYVLPQLDKQPDSPIRQYYLAFGWDRFTIIGETESGQFVDTQCDVPVYHSSEYTKEQSHEDTTRQILSNYTDFTSYMNSPVSKSLYITLELYTDYPAVKEYVDSHVKLSPFGSPELLNDLNTNGGKSYSDASRRMEDSLETQLLQTVLKPQLEALVDSFMQKPVPPMPPIEMPEGDRYGYQIFEGFEKSDDDLPKKERSYYLTSILNNARDAGIPYFQLPQAQQRAEFLKALVNKYILNVNYDQIEIESDYFRIVHALLQAISEFSVYFDNSAIVQEALNHLNTFIPHTAYDKKKVWAVREFTHSEVVKAAYNAIAAIDHKQHRQALASKLSWQILPTHEDEELLDKIKKIIPEAKSIYQYTPTPSMLKRLKDAYNYGNGSLKDFLQYYVVDTGSSYSYKIVGERSDASFYVFQYVEAPGAREQSTGGEQAHTTSEIQSNYPSFAGFMNAAISKNHRISKQLYDERADVKEYVNSHVSFPVDKGYVVLTNDNGEERYIAHDLYDELIKTVCYRDFREVLQQIGRQDTALPAPSEEKGYFASPLYPLRHITDPIRHVVSQAIELNVPYLKYPFIRKIAAYINNIVTKAIIDVTYDEVPDNSHYFEEADKIFGTVRNDFAVFLPNTDVLRKALNRVYHFIPHGPIDKKKEYLLYQFRQSGVLQDGIDAIAVVDNKLNKRFAKIAWNESVNNDDGFTESYDIAPFEDIKFSPSRQKDLQNEVRNKKELQDAEKFDGKGVYQATDVTPEYSERDFQPYASKLSWQVQEAPVKAGDFGTFTDLKTGELHLGFVIDENIDTAHVIFADELYYKSTLAVSMKSPSDFTGFKKAIISVDPASLIEFSQEISWGRESGEFDARPVEKGEYDRRKKYHKRTAWGSKLSWQVDRPLEGWIVKATPKGTAPIYGYIGKELEADESTSGVHKYLGYWYNDLEEVKKALHRKQAYNYAVWPSSFESFEPVEFVGISRDNSRFGSKENACFFYVKLDGLPEELKDVKEPHVTVVYAKANIQGEDREAVIKEIQEMLKDQEAPTLNFTGLAEFGNADRSKVILINFQNGAKLYSNLINILQKYTEIVRDYDFIPHMTVDKDLNDLPKCKWTPKSLFLEFEKGVPAIEVQFGTGKLKESESVDGSSTLTVEKVASMYSQMDEDKEASLYSVIGKVYSKANTEEIYKTLQEKAAILMYSIANLQPVSNDNSQVALQAGLELLNSNHLTIHASKDIFNNGKTYDDVYSFICKNIVVL